MTTATGKVVLISGASGGLGETVTRAFLDGGYRVAGTSRSWKKDREPEGEFLAVEADLTTAEGCRGAVRSTLERWGRLYAAVHLMGGFASEGGLETTGEATWDRMMALNAKSGFLFFQAAIEPLRAAGEGRLLAVGSRAGAAPSAGVSAYAASKAALHALVLSLAEELKGSGITSNAVLPSTIDTAANRRAMPGADFGRWVPAASIANLLVYLASPDASQIQGALIPVYGGS